MRNKWIVFRREYLNKVTDKKFLIFTMLTPLMMLLLIAVVSLIFSYQGDDEKNIAILDKQGVMNNRLKDQSNFYFQFVNGDLEELIAMEEKSWDGLLHLKPLRDLTQVDVDVDLYSDKALDFEKTLELESILTDKLRNFKLRELDISEEIVTSLDPDVSIRNKPLDPDKAEKDSFLASGLGSAMGMFIGFALFMMITINGNLVFQSVMEEKTNRIVEIMISTVKPVDLMIGKILAAVSVGFTQILIWMVTIPIVFLLASLVFGLDMTAIGDASSAAQIQSTSASEMEDIIMRMMEEISKVNWWKVLLVSISFFLGGYFIYATIYAALGALAGDDPQQSSSLIFPVSMLSIIGFYLIVPVTKSPESSLSLWSSLVPFFSPILMPGLAFVDLPWWRYVLSFVILIVSCYLITLLTAKIYRMGIMLYGKKITFSEVWRTLFSA